ncbi:XRE family transcriptional regulator, partial [Mycobacteroides abscessus subsp. abscessus]
MKLEPTEAQRKAMAAALPDLIVERDAREDLLEWPEIVDEMIAAANSIPEGAPVGTIARASDGHNIAVRKRFSDGVHWAYLYDSDVDIFGYKVADSWPVIFAP